MLFHLLFQRPVFFFLPLGFPPFRGEKPFDALVGFGDELRASQDLPTHIQYTDQITDAGMRCNTEAFKGLRDVVKVGAAQTKRRVDAFFEIAAEGRRLPDHIAAAYGE